MSSKLFAIDMKILDFVAFDDQVAQPENILIFDTEKEEQEGDGDRITHTELRQVYSNHVGNQVPATISWGAIRKAVFGLGGKFTAGAKYPVTPDEHIPTGLAQQLAKTAPQTTKAPRKQRENKPKDGLPSSSKRPKPGTKTAQVWDICDSFGTKDPVRKDVIAKCVEAGINATTAGVQYSKWRNSQ